MKKRDEVNGVLLNFSYKADYIDLLSQYDKLPLGKTKIETIKVEYIAIS